jgi:hypothetical protein
MMVCEPRRPELRAVSSRGGAGKAPQKQGCEPFAGDRRRIEAHRLDLTACSETCVRLT